MKTCFKRPQNVSLLPRLFTRFGTFIALQMTFGAALISNAFPASNSPPPTTPAQQAETFLRSRPELDTLVFSDPSMGSTHARIMKATTTGVVAEKGANSREFPLADIAEIHFHTTIREKELLQRRSVDDLALIQIIWESRSATLKIKGSQAADWALLFAQVLRLKGDQTSWAKARALAVTIEENATDPKRQTSGRYLRELLDFEKLLSAGDANETELAARHILEVGDDGNEALLLLVLPFLASREFDALKALEKENPRWMDDDDEVKPTRERHYHIALDMFLYPFLFFGARNAEAAEGLWGAAHVYLHAEKPEQAAQCLRDISDLYSDTKRAKEAAALLKQIAQPVPAVANVKSIKKKSDDKTPKKTSSEPPKKYSLFDE